MSAILLPGDVGYDEPMHYHDTNRGGFVSLLTQDGTMRKQRSFKLEELPDQLKCMRGRPDVWVGQCEFFRPNRRKVNLWRMPLCFVDLDTYNVPELKGLSPAILVEILLETCEDRGIPQPTTVVHSGRGLQVKWIFETPAVRRALPRWSLVQRVLQEKLAKLGADAGALDASRVLRLTGTINSRSGQQVYVADMARTVALGGCRLPNGLVGYDFDVFADTLLPKTRQEIEEGRKEIEAERKSKAESRKVLALMRHADALGPAERQQASCLHGLQVSRLAWDRLEDLRQLVKLRWCDGDHFLGLPSGSRNAFMFVAACFLADCCTPGELMPELFALRDEFAPQWTNGELKDCVHSALQRAHASARGETVAFNGQAVPPRYRWSNTGLIEFLGVTSAEERVLGTIVSKTEATRRNTERQRLQRRTEGMQPRKEYLQAVHQRRQEAISLHNEGWSGNAIAKHLGISKGTVRNYCREQAR